MSLPKNFTSTIQRLENYAKQTVIFEPDRKTGVKPGDTIKATFPRGSLVDLRSLRFYYKGVANNCGSKTAKFQNRFFPRNTSSVIASLAVSINGQQIERIDRYSHIFNLLWDYSCSLENNMSAKNALQNTDPSTKTYIAPANGVISSYKNTDETDLNSSDGVIEGGSGRDFCISNWLGFLGTSSCEILDLSTIGDLTIEIRFEPANILWKSKVPTGGAVDTNVVATPDYTLNDIYFSINRITFQNDTFYGLQNAKLASDGIPLAFKTFTFHSTNVGTKDINMSFAVNSQRLNKVICTCVPNDYTTENLLQLDAGTTFLQALTTQVTTQADPKDLFNQSYYFRKDGNGIETSLFQINNISTTPAPLRMPEIFNANMEALNIQDDMNNGLHPGCYDLNAWRKYYFCHIISLEHRMSESDFWLQGYDGRNASINCKWTCTKHSGNNQQVFPFVFCEHSKLLQINAQQQVTILY